MRELGGVLGWTTGRLLVGGALSGANFDYETNTYVLDAVFHSSTANKLQLEFKSTGAGDIANKETRDKLNLHIGEGAGEQVFNLGAGMIEQSRIVSFALTTAPWAKGDEVLLRMRENAAPTEATVIQLGGVAIGTAAPKVGQRLTVDVSGIADADGDGHGTPTLPHGAADDAVQPAPHQSRRLQSPGQGGCLSR